MIIRGASIKDFQQIFDLYFAVSQIKDGIARTTQEISQEYISGFINNSLNNGLIFVIEKDGKIIAEIHCYKYDPQSLKHVMANLTLVVHPDFTRQGLGKKIFTHLIEQIEEQFPEVSRIELFSRQSNKRAISLYQSLGFVIEAICQKRILNSQNQLENDVFMARIKP